MKQLDLMDWIQERANEGGNLVKPDRSAIHDQPGYGIVIVDAEGRDFTFADLWSSLEAWAGQGVSLSPALARSLAEALIGFADRAALREGDNRG